MSCIVVAVSGGADSLYALISLQEQGHDVVALHGLFLPSQSSALQGLSELCKQRKIPLHIIDFKLAFDKEVVLPFIEAYANGFTPNPCALCNKEIKFGLLLQKAFELGGDYFATGHYASVSNDEVLKNSSQDLLQNMTKSPLYKGQDVLKDQSYFLSLVPKEQFKHVLFPLAQRKKVDNIVYLQERNINIPIAKESQEICFIPNDAYRDFLLVEAKKRKVTLGKEGQILVREQGVDNTLPAKFGGMNGDKHVGLWQYTEGQRKGLGIAWKEPLYVCAKDYLNNNLILGNKEEAVLRSCLVHKLNFFVDYKYWPSELLVRVRYRQKEALAKVSLSNDLLKISFDMPQTPTAPGQVATIYDSYGGVLAGGIIKEVSTKSFF